MAIPKKPLAVSRAKKKLPVELDWGPGIPKDRLRYINADEEALIKRFRTSKSARDYAGIPAYADDSASSKGMERSGTTTGKTTGSTSSSSSSSRSSSGGLGQGGQSRGPSGAGQGPNSPSSSASSSASSASTGSKSPSAASNSFSAASPAGSKSASAPNAAAQAASNAFRSSQTNASATVGGSKAPNMAAAYASQKLNATSSALKAGQQPQSIQSMINAGQTAPNGSYYGPKGGNYLNTNARMAAARSVGFNPPPVQRTPGDAEAMGRMMMAESATIRNQYGNPSVPGLMGVGEVMRNRMLSERFPDTVQEVMSQRKQFSPWGDGSYAKTPANEMATRIAESILSGESPPTVGTSLNYGNIDTINNKPNYSSAASKAAFNSMPVEARIADARNPKTFSHTFGTIGAPSDVAFNGTGAATTDLASQRPQAIPAPSSTGLAGIMSPSQVAGDPRVSTPPGGYAAPKERVLGTETYVDSTGIRDPQAATMSAPALPGFSPPGLSPNFRGTAGVASTGYVPGWGYSPLADGRPVADAPNQGWASPSTFSPEAAPGDSVPEDGPSPVYSDNPMQGPSNPVQESPAVEDPGVTKQRQTKYASRGATIGSVIAGPLGAVIGGTLGWQMGKTPPGQRRAIASNPQALQANVQSINTMVEERGGKGNPQMRVTDAGLKDVLENPAKVAQNPQSYTTLEQMLASLALGVDPETGQPI